MRTAVALVLGVWVATAGAIGLPLARGPLGARPTCNGSNVGKVYTATDCASTACTDNKGTVECDTYCQGGTTFQWVPGLCLTTSGIVSVNDASSDTTSVGYQLAHSASASFNGSPTFTPADTGSGGNMRGDAWQFQPPLTNTPGLTTYRLTAWDTPFNGTKDPTFGFGYNESTGGDRSVATQPYLSWDLETDYNDSVNHNVEFYFQYRPTNVGGANTVSKRPIFWQFRRDGVGLGSFILRNQGITFQQWWANADCTAASTPWACCTGNAAGTCDTTDANWGVISPTTFQLAGQPGQTSDTSATYTAQNAHDAFSQWSAGGKSLTLKMQNSGSAALLLGGSGNSLSISGGSLIQNTNNGHYSQAMTWDGTTDIAGFEETDTITNTVTNGGLHVGFYTHGSISGGNKTTTYEGWRTYLNDAGTLANTDRGGRCYLGGVTNANAVKKCLELDAETANSGTNHGAAIDSTGYVKFKGAAATCGTGCASVASGTSYLLGDVTTGTTVTSVTVNWPFTLDVAPVCVANINDATKTVQPTSITTGLVTFTVSAAVSSAHIYYHCFQKA